MASSDTLAVFMPQMNEPPTASFATPDERVDNNGRIHPVLDFDAAADEFAQFSSVMPQNYTAAAAISVIVEWACTSAISGTVTWTAQVERGNTDMDTDSFAAAQTADGTANGTSGVTTFTTISLTNAQADSIAKGERFRLLVSRNQDSGTDDIASDVELRSVEIREA